MEIEPFKFFVYLHVIWPDLEKKLMKEPIPKMIEHLDIVCKIKKSELFTLPQACARWQGILEEMYAINGNLEF